MNPKSRFMRKQTLNLSNLLKFVLHIRTAIL